MAGPDTGRDHGVRRAGVLAGTGAGSAYGNAGELRRDGQQVIRYDTAGTALASVTLAAGAISWAPVALPATVNMAVGVGLRHCGVVSSATTRGCFGLAYNDTPPIPVAVKPTPAVARDSSRRPAGRPSS